MHPEILNENQKELLNLINKFYKGYYLVGGTAIAMHLGHRRSIDFDLFTATKINHTAIKNQLAISKFRYSLIVQKPDQIHFIVNSVKLTFFNFPFKISISTKYHEAFKMPDLLTLAAMKAFALGGRGKWKDYVDLYFILKNHYTLNEICQKATSIFGDSFSPYLFQKQI